MKNIMKILMLGLISLSSSMLYSQNVYLDEKKTEIPIELNGKWSLFNYTRNASSYNVEYLEIDENKGIFSLKFKNESNPREYKIEGYYGASLKWVIGDKNRLSMLIGSKRDNGAPYEKYMGFFINRDLVGDEYM